jgi:hypothetical protein
MQHNTILLQLQGNNRAMLCIHEIFYYSLFYLISGSLSAPTPLHMIRACEREMEILLHMRCFRSREYLVT